MKTFHHTVFFHRLCLLLVLGFAPACVPGGLTADDQPLADDEAEDVGDHDAAVQESASRWWPDPCPDLLCPEPGPTDTTGIDGEVDAGAASLEKVAPNQPGQTAASGVLDRR